MIDTYIQTYKRHNHDNSKTEKVKWRQWNGVPVLLILPYQVGLFIVVYEF